MPVRQTKVYSFLHPQKNKLEVKVKNKYSGEWETVWAMVTKDKFVAIVKSFKPINE